jgi:hypothetical protein
MSTSDKILIESFRHAVDLIGKARTAADGAVQLVHNESTNVKVCSAHNAMVDMQVANLGYMRALGEGIEYLLTGAITVLNDRIEKRNWGSTLIYINLALFAINILLQFVDVVHLVK